MTHVERETSTTWTQPARRPSVDLVIASVAARQHAMISLAQLRQAGLSGSAVRSRASAGRLHRIHRGVYSIVPGPWTYLARCIAATLAYGPGAAISHRSAAHVLGLGTASSPVIEVTVVGGHVDSRPGVRAHRAAFLATADRASADSIPCTSVARTLLDIAARGPEWLVRRSFEQADKQQLLDASALRAARERAPGHHGLERFDRVLSTYAGPTGTRRELERRFLDLILRVGLPRPEVNVWLPDAAMEVDFLWRDWRFVVETDSREHHHTTFAFQRDRERDRSLHRHRYVPVRYTWADVTGAADRTVKEVADFLAALGPG